MNSQQSAIRLRGVHVGYVDGGIRRAVLEDLDLSVIGGTALAVTGPSGSGKSTLLNVLAGLLAIDAGEVWVGVNEPAPVAVHTLNRREATRYRRRHLGYVFQFFNLVPTLTVAENVRLPIELNRMSDAWPECEARLAALELAERQHDFPHQLSGGQRQRVALARALAHRPSLVLADEPTGNLDADNTARVAQLLFAQVRAAGTTLVIATHNPDIAAMADQHLRLGG